MKPANAVLSGYGTTIFEVMSRLAIEVEAINLGQGFPDEDGPEDLDGDCTVGQLDLLELLGNWR